MLLISYDLNDPDRDYEPLFDAIGALGDWWHYLGATWLVDTPLDAAEVAGQIVGLVGEADRLLVIGVDRSQAQGWLPAEAWSWINSPGRG